MVLHVEATRGIMPSALKRETISENATIVQSFLDACIANRASVWRTAEARAKFLAFFSPVQVGDEKPPGFSLPYKIELM
jgi:hypothetical protein